MIPASPRTGSPPIDPFRNGFLNHDEEKLELEVQGTKCSIHEMEDCEEIISLDGTLEEYFAIGNQTEYQNEKNSFNNSPETANINNNNTTKHSISDSDWIRVEVNNILFDKLWSKIIPL